MSGWAEEAESACSLADQAVKELSALDPTNILLWWWILPPEGIQDPFESEEDQKIKFKDTYWQKPEPWNTQAGAIVVAVTVSNYFFAVEKEIERIKALSPSV